MPKHYKTSLLIGNVLEWYDFALYGFFTHIIASLFFPQLSHASSILATIAGFTAGFITRPLGGWILGSIGDKYGTKKALMLSLALMFFPAFSIAVVPTYATIGIWAPVILLLARLLQGFSSGGEIAIVTFSLLEGNPKKQRLKYISISLICAYFGTLLAALSSFLLTHFSDHNFLVNYAWRYLLP